LLVNGRLPLCQSNSKRCIILGNGPSLKNTLPLLDKHGLKNTDLFCVNDFPLTPEYEKLKPAHYLFLDPSYYVDNISEEFKKRRTMLFNSVKEKTTWDVSLYLPNFLAKKEIGKKEYWGKHINIFFYNTASPTITVSMWNSFFKKNKLMPHPQNILIAAIYIALNRGYKEIYVCGADHSWHRDIEVNEQNQVCTRSSHFYSNGKVELKPWYTDESKTEVFSMSRVFRDLTIVFESHLQLAAYAKYIGAEVYNSSTDTCIDAYTRKSLESI
jgi:hypothetical protein